VQGKAQPSRHSGVYSSLGVLSIVFWGSTVAFSRNLIEEVGLFTAAAAIYGTGAVIMAVYLVAKPGAWRALRALPPRYRYGCGGLFVFYAVAIYTAVGSAAGRAQVVEVGIVNYLWPSLTFAFSVPVLRRRADWTLPLGIALAMCGTVLAMSHETALTWSGFRGHVMSNPRAYGAALAAAVSWALYNNLSRRWASEVHGEAVPAFLGAAAVALLLLRLGTVEESHWSVRAGLELAYLAVFVTVFAYGFWDLAMRKGNIGLVTSCSYFTPLLSTAISSAYLGVELGPQMWLGCLLVMAGAVICHRAVRQESPHPDQNATRS